MSRRILFLLALATALAGLATPAGAHVRWNVDIGVPMFGYWGPGWGPGWYPPPPVYVQPPVILQAPPTVIVQPAAPLGVAPPSYWYYCYNPAGYYPQVQNCPAGWTPVPAQPAPPPPPPVAPQR